ncbi:MAG: hypothetical protein ACFFF9_05310 [Candidatus Thorarchaeota archaeon]
MSEVRRKKSLEKCHNCQSENIVGPYQAMGNIWFSTMSSVSKDAYVCGDCYHVMMFIIEKDERKVKREIEKKTHRNT